MTSYELRKKMTANKAARDKILSVVERSPEVREMNLEEDSEYTRLEKEYKGLQGLYNRRLEIEDGEDDPGQPETRSRRVSDPIREEPEAPAVHTKEHRYSYLRAMRMHHLEQRSLDGIEGEYAQEIARKVGKPARGCYLPLGNEPEFQEGLYGKAALETRDLTTATAPGGIFTMRMDPLIEMLRNRLVVKQAGARVVTDATGNFAFTRQNGTATAYWVGEGVPGSPSNATTDQVTYSGKQCIALTNITKAFLKQNSFDAEQFVKDDLAAVLAQAIDIAALNGAGGSTTPLGILQDPSVPNITGPSANGDFLDWAATIALETALNNANTNRGKPAMITTNGVRGYLKNIARLNNTNGNPIWENPADDASDGWVNGYRAFATSNMPSNLVKGTSGATLHSLIFGNFNDLLLAQWGGIDTLINPFTLQASGGETISASIFADSHVIRPQSFRTRTDLKV